MYASYHFSHPILSERLGALGWYGDSKAGASEKESKGEKVAQASGREL
jgi:STE24 endopeptidase